MHEFVSRPDRGALRWLTSASVLSLAFASPAFAQTASNAVPPPASQEVPSETQEPSTGPTSSDGVAGDIIVTATRQSSAVSKVPLSITALNQDSLDVQGVKRIDDIARIAPGINFVRPTAVNNAGNRVQISIRGIESNVGASTTGIYVDDTPLQTRNAGFTSTSIFPVVFDLDRVEVLRGPQGTLFGSGSEGGTVRFITPQPSLDRYSVYARAEVAATQYGAPSYEAGAAVGGPIVQDSLGFRVSAFYRRDGGWIDRVDFNTGAVNGKNENDATSFVVRGALTWQPAPNLRFTPSIFYQKTTATNGATYWPILSDPDDGVFRSGNTLKSPSRDEFTLYTLKADWELGGADIISNTSYFDRNTEAFPDYTNFVRGTQTGSILPTFPGEFSQGIFNGRQRGFTQEVRLQSANPDGPLNWVVGVFYNRTKQLDSQMVSSPFFPQIVFQARGRDYISVFGTPLGPNDSVFTDMQNTVDEQIAGFGQLDWNITSKLKLTAGARYAKVDFSFRSNSDGPLAGKRSTSGVQEEKPFTPKVGIAYQADPSNLFYASVSEGFRPGGAQRVPPVACAGDLAALGITSGPGEYKADSVLSYEIGAKNRLFKRLQVNSSAFWIDWDDIQQVVSLRGCGQNFISNLGKGISRGFDVEASLNVPGGVTLSALVGYTDARSATTIVSGNATIARDGAPISTISPWRARLSGQYDFDAYNKDAFVRVDYEYASKGPQPDIRIFGTDPILFRRPASNVLNARAGLDFGAVSVQVFANNLTNYNEPRAVFRPTNAVTIFTAGVDRPRTIGLTLIGRY